ncbi:MAG: HlyD family secretion protein [Zoogloeaceae bacterium]|jgi:membrane fusion protein (multidrug efflux system)|nr:HlyD family secretion protein [Zoogloeaceae bacterium]
MTLAKFRMASAGVLMALVLGGIFHFNRPESDAARQSTDDAYVQADFTTVAPRVSGTMAKVLVEDNQRVKSGELLAILDDRDFILALDGAKAQVASAEASIASIEAHLTLQESNIRQAQAAVNADDAAIRLAQANQTRYRNLAADGSGSVQAREQAESQLIIHQANRRKNRAGWQAARQRIDILQADLQKAKAVLAQARTARAAAELNLSHTRIIAPIDGIVGQKSLRTGAFVHVGTPLLAIVPLDAVYIAAHFRETQLARIQPGQRVDIKIDALPGAMLRGKVESLEPASGVSYSAIAPLNATGNFTKITRRFRVRIRIDPGQPAAERLRAGMSAQPEIHVGSAGHA